MTSLSSKTFEDNKEWVAEWLKSTLPQYLIKGDLIESGMLEYLLEGELFDVDAMRAHREYSELLADVLKEEGRKVGNDFRHDDRMATVEAIVSDERYAYVMSDRCKSSLADVILYGDLEGNTSPDKMTNQEYPIMSDTQYARRTGRKGVRGSYEVSSIWLENVSTLDLL